MDTVFAVPGCRTTSSADGDVVIAAITSCTNTSNPAVMLGAGLVAQERFAAKGLTVQAVGQNLVGTWIQSRHGVSGEDGRTAGQTWNALGFNLVGYGCTTCIGNSGPLPDHISAAINDGNLVVSLGPVG